MTIPTNMKQIGCLICLAVLLPGCTWIEAWIESLRPTVTISYFSYPFDLEVDGRLYFCQVDNLYDKGEYDYTKIRATRLSEERSKEYSEFKEARENGEEWTVEDISFSGSGKVLPPILPNHFQVIDDEGNTVLFETPLEVLGVCVVFNDWQFSGARLKEAMIKLIRENVTPPEPDTE